MVRLRIAVMLGWFLAIGAGSVMATENASPGIDGKVLLVQNCARCHAVDAAGNSPLKGARAAR